MIESISVDLTITILLNKISTLTFNGILRLAGGVRSAFAEQNTQTHLSPANKKNHFSNSIWDIENS